MKWKRIAVLLVGYFVFSILASVSCEPCGGEAGRYRMQGLTAEGVLIDTTGGYHYSSVTAGDTIPYGNFGILLDADLEFFYVQGTPPALELLSAAYACSPALPTTTESLKDMRIYANADFDSLHPAGTNLADVFDVFSYTDFKRIKLSEYLSRYPSVPYGGEWILLLRTPPDSARKFVFTIKTEQFGGKYTSFQATTQEVIIK